MACCGEEEEGEGDGDGEEEEGCEVATTMVAPAGSPTFLCLAGGGTSWFSTLALLTDFSTTALQIS